jgi:hypothetical protein
LNLYFPRGQVHYRLDIKDGIARVEEQCDTAIGRTGIAGRGSLDADVCDQEIALAPGEAGRLQLCLHGWVAQRQLLRLLHLLDAQAWWLVPDNRKMLDPWHRVQGDYGRDGFIRVIVVEDYIGTPLACRSALVVLVSFDGHRPDSLAGCQARAGSIIALKHGGCLLYFRRRQWLKRLVQVFLDPYGLVLRLRSQRQSSKRQSGQERAQQGPHPEIWVTDLLHRAAFLTSPASPKALPIELSRDDHHSEIMRPTQRR